MKITIEYEASWRNSFLDGSNNEPLPKNGRNFIGSMTTLKQAGNFIQHSISKNTVMGVLNRLIGDQRKLYQARQEPHYYFSDIEELLQDNHIVDTPLVTKEMTYIRNVSGSTDKSSFTGLIKDNHPTFNSDYSPIFWGVLWLEKSILLDFILNDDFQVPSISQDKINVLSVAEKATEIDKLKNIPQEKSIIDAVQILNRFFPTEEYVEKDGTIKLIRLYAGAMYIQLSRLQSKFNMDSACNKRGASVFIYGFSKRGFNGFRDLVKNFITGKEKPIWGNPYMLKEKKKGEGEVVSVLTKASGTLEITLDIPKEKAKELNQMIENAGVSAFYLGKKGLAYVSDIKI